ncbi:MAG: TolB family protein [Opitutales bacterium]
MNLSKNKVSRLFQFFTCFCLVHLSQAQNIDLGIQFTGAQPTQVPVGSVFAITGQVFVEANATGVTAGQTVVATAEFKDPDGLLIGSHTQTWNGFPDGPSTLDNDLTGARQVLFTIPWSQAQKWQALDGNKSQWSVTLRLDGVTGEVSLATNQQTHFFEVIIPDLEVRDNPVVSATDLTTGNLSNVFLPNTEVTVQGVVENIGGVTTQEGVLFPLIARLLNANGTVMDEEMIVLPNNGNTRMLAGDVINFTIPNLHVPPNAAANETFTVEVIVDPTDLATGQHLVFETDDTTNNRKQVNFTISAPSPILTVDPDSFEGDTGTFRGLAPVRLSFSVRNTGTVSVGAGDIFNAQVHLSENDTSSNDDFILREFDLSGSALGANLLPNETITFDWIQQLPDNFEGDYYLVVNINDVDFALENTPVITLISENSGNTERVATENRSTERPHSSSDGTLVVYEETDTSGIQQIFLSNMQSGDTIQLTNSFSNPNIGGNGDSLRPRISADGSTVVFHSMASDLVAGDENEHADVFLYRTFTQQLTRAQNFGTGEEPNNNSYYPDLNLDGSIIVFESDATNLQSTGVVNSGRQIFLWDLKTDGYGPIRCITNGNADSKSATIDYSGNLVVFSSYASNLLDVADVNGQEDVFLFKVDENKTYLASLTALGMPADDSGFSTSPAISGDGSTIAFVSSASNMVFGKGVSHIQVLSGGAGYSGNPTAIVSDLNGNGNGAILSLANAIDDYGQVLESGIEIVSGGSGYRQPIVSIISDPTQPSPTEVAQVKAKLSHPDGEVYAIQVADILSVAGPSSFSSRISESNLGIGGDMQSREPSISYDGQFIAYTTKSSNLLDQNITREDGTVFYNQPGKIATARAIIVGGIGEIEIRNSGIGYNAGFLKIEDFSGNGSGAVASYQVDSANGRIISINILNQGSNYQLDTTEITVDNPNGGSGFQAGTLRFPSVIGFGNNRTGGGKIHKIEMIENGNGYQLPQDDQNISSIISLDGDGVDLDSDGKPDAKVNGNRIKLGPNGEVFLEQRFDIEILSTGSLDNTTLTFSDYNKSIDITFGNSASVLQVNTTGKDASTIRDEVLVMILTQWKTPEQLTDGPLIENNASGGKTFTFKALSGVVQTNNPSSVRVTSRSNMLFSGGGFTRATPVIAPPAVIYGYSEILSGTTVVSTSDGRQLSDVLTDTQTDDIYLYDMNNSLNERVSKSTFGFPVNYLPSSVVSMPSNRFPSISSDGRYVFFSSDAAGRGGLAFGNSNQSPIDNNLVRDVLRHDRKTQAISQTPNVTATMLNPSSTDISLNKYSLGNQIEISVSATATLGTIEQVELFLDGKPLNLPISFPPADPILGQYSRDGIYGFNWTPTRPGVYELSVRARDNFGRYSKLNQMSKSIVTVGADSLGEKPIVIMTEPVPGGFGDTFPDYSYGSQLFINVEAYDPDGDLEYVQIYLNGQLLGNAEGRYGNTYIYKWTIQRQDADQQSFVIQAIAKDNDGNIVRSGSLSGITVENNLSQRPTVRLDRVTVDQEGVKLRAIAGQQGNFFSGVSRVQFFANGVTIDAIGSPTSFLSTGEEAYDLTWKPEKAGVYTLYAMAVGSVGDNGDHYTISSPLVFEVTEFHLSSFNSDNVAPMITLVSPGPHSSGIAFATAEMGSLVDETATNYRSVVNLSVSSPGYGYSEPPQVIFYGGGGTGASATASIMNGAVTKVNLINKGSGYPKTLKLQPSTVVSGVGLDMTPVVKDGVLTSIPIASGGSGYSSTDLVSIFDLQNQAYAGFGARAVPIVDANGSILSLKILDAGQNYDPAYMQVSILGNGSGFEANASNATIENGVVSEVLISSTGSGYTNGFSIIPVPGTDGAGSGFNAEVKTEDIMDGTVSLNLISGGSGYSTKPDVILDGGKFLNYDYPLTFVENSRVILQARSL